MKILLSSIIFVFLINFIILNPLENNMISKEEKQKAIDESNNLALQIKVRISIIGKAQEIINNNQVEKIIIKIEKEVNDLKNCIESYRKDKTIRNCTKNIQKNIKNLKDSKKIIDKLKKSQEYKAYLASLLVGNTLEELEKEIFNQLDLLRKQNEITISYFK